LNLAAIFSHLSFPLFLKKKFCFRRNSVFELKVPKGLLKPGQKLGQKFESHGRSLKARHQQQSSSRALCFQLETSNG